MKEVEVCVIGAGPAGAALATRLAQLGHDVAIAEQHRFPRPHVGESLSPAIWPLLDVLGVRDRVADAGFVSTSVALVRWREEEAQRLEVAGGLTVERGAFDAILLARAVQAGARLLHPARAQRPVRADGRWSVAVGADTLRARFVVDASGRRRLLGGSCPPTSPRTIALHATWRGVSPRDGEQTRVDVLDDGWLWGAHLPGGAFRAMAFADPRSLRAAGREPRRLYHRMLRASPLLGDMARRATLVGRVHACGATCYAAPAPIDAASIRVGEAAFAIDPLSSSGVQSAIQTALAGAAAVHTILDEASDSEVAIRYYTEQQAHAVDSHHATAARLYAEQRPHAGTPFWASRGIGPEDPPRVRAAAPPLAELLARRVGLSDGAELHDTPCVVGDRVELRRALAHPALERPVAFLGGHELAPLLDALDAAPSLAQAIDRWDATLATGGAAEVARWLHERGLLAARP